MKNNRERVGVLAAICLLLYFAVEDIIEDLGRGDSLAQIGLDMSVVAAIACLLAYIYILEPLKMRRDNKVLSESNHAQNADLKRMSQIAEKHLHGLGIYIKAQFEEWDLTLAEQEVALLLLKGMSMKEIAEIRDGSERTARQQATQVYDKAGLAGRAALSGFFLEDLLLPNGVS
ncbi:MAG: helix-turn-helix transcriptional regulator [Hyphomicrobiales bacterium]